MSDAAQGSNKLPSRREFIKHSTLAAVGTGLASGLVIPRSAHAAGDDTIKIALIGCGGRGTGAASQALRADSNVKLVAMGDAFGDRLSGALTGLQKDGEIRDKIDVPKERQFTGFDAYKQAIDSGVDLVILATPPGFRPIHFKAAVDAGKHVFMEKPVATDANGVRTVLAATKKAKEKNLAVGVGLQRRHQAHYIEAMDKLKSGAIGDVMFTRVYWNGSTPWVHPRAELEKKKGAPLTEMEYQMRNWYYFAWLCGDHIVEQHIHNMDVSNWLKGGPPVKANGMGGCQVRKGPDYGETFDHHCVEFEYADGTKMFSQCRHIPNCWNAVNEHVHGTKGTAFLDGSRAELYLPGAEPLKFGGTGRSRSRDRKAGNPYQVEHDELFAAIRKGTPYNEGEYGASSTMTAILGRMATYSGKEIEYDKALNSQINLVPSEFGWDVSPPVPSMAVPGQTQVV